MKSNRPVYTVFHKPDRGDVTDIRMWLDINGNDYVFVDRDYAETVDFFILNSYNSSVQFNYRQKLKFVIFHGFEDFVKHQCNRRDCHVITNGWDPTINNERIIFNDFLFNRTKAYYSQYPFSPGTQLWYYHDMIAYKAPQLITADSKKKIFVCPGKTYNGERKYRTQLISKIRNYNTLGYVGNYDDDPNLFLHSQIEFPAAFTNINELEKETQTKFGSQEYYLPQGYSPPHSEYYKNTFVSIYGETIEYGNTIMITEKTWDPLIKGHFILPFSCCNFIQRLRSVGIALPAFIDYSYDAEPNDERRWQLYSVEIDRLLAMDLDTWRQHWNDNLDLLLANQRYFHTRDYDRVDLAQLLKL
jgi:hypothetical protein